MPLDEVTEILRNMEPPRVHELLGLINGEEAGQIRELLSHGRGVAGSIMNTDFVAVRKADTIGRVLALVKSEYAEAESIYYIYVTDEESRLTGELTLRDLLTAKRTLPVAEVCSENVVKVSVYDDLDEVAAVFYRYNFTVVPVVDAEERLVGTITMKDAFEAVFPEIRAKREESS
jgi:magnesium transporter